MADKFGNSLIKDQLILDHPASLFVLFFTEMWERFSYYGMRALLVLFLTASLMKGGYGWERSNALELYALYTGLVYLTPLLGGIIADKITGYRKAVVLGAFIMALGHGFMAIEAIPAFFYAGLTCLIIGNGLFKPNISSMVGQLYKDDESKKDSAYTIFYMGINAGAFLGILLCGYIGETIGWSYGFGLAGIFMLLGMLQFWFAQSIFGDIGLTPKKETNVEDVAAAKAASEAGNSRLGMWAGIGIAIAAIIYFLIPKEAGAELLSVVNKNYIPPFLFGTVTAIVGFIVTDPSLTKVEKDRVWVIIILTFFTIFFWWAFEQAGGSMTIFAGDYTNRDLVGSGAMIFKVVNAVLTLGSLGVITWVLFKLFNVTFSQISTSNIILGFSFVVIWGLAIWMLVQQFQGTETQVPASWFSILNSFFIITLAPAVSKFWEKGIITSGPIKFAMGLIILGLGFGILAWGANGIPQGAKTASVSMIWLVLAYFFHTAGELCVSPVGLSYVSKLAPVRLIGLMFGVWFIANFIANWAGGMTGSYIDQIVESTSMSTFFLIFTLIPIGAGVVLILLKGFMKKMMHGID